MVKEESKDGFKKFNEIPVNPIVTKPTKPKSAEETLKENLFKKPESLEKKGVY